MPSSRIACRKPRLRHDGGDDGVVGQPAPLAQRDREQREDLVAVDDLAVRVDRQAAVRVTVVRDADVGPVLDHRGLRDARGAWRRSPR